MLPPLLRLLADGLDGNLARVDTEDGDHDDGDHGDHCHHDEDRGDTVVVEQERNQVRGDDAADASDGVRETGAAELCLGGPDLGNIDCRGEAHVHLDGHLQEEDQRMGCLP